MFEKQYKETFSQVVASDSLMQEVLNLKNKRNKKIRVTTLLAAVILMFALATTAFAYTSFVVYENPGQMLEALFGNSSNPSNDGKVYVDDVGQIVYEPSFEKEELNEQAAEEYVAPHIFKVGQFITHNGNTLTVDAVTYDPYTQCGVLYLHIDMKNPDVLPEYYLVRPDGELVWHGPDVAYCDWINMTYFIDETQTTDSCLTLAGYFYKADYMEQAILKIGLYDNTGTSAENIVIPLADALPMEHITLGNGGIQLSPIGAVVHGEALGFLRGDGSTDARSLCIRYTDGSEYLVVDDTGEVSIINHARAYVEPGDGYETNRNCVTYLLNRIVPVHEVAAVIVNGISYSVDSEPIDTPVVSGPEAGAADEGIYTIDPTFTIHANNDPVIGQPLEFTEGLSSGKLTYSITGAEIIHRIQDIPVDMFDYEVVPQKVLDSFAGKRVYRWSWLEQQHREKINEDDGTFNDDLCLVFVYVTAETSDARGNSFGDSSWFEANRLMLVDSKNPEFAVPVSYFSEGWGDLGPEGNPVLSLLPNETNYVAFGFLVKQHNPDGSPVDFSSFCIRGTEGDTKNILIPLGLENP